MAINDVPIGTLAGLVSALNNPAGTGFANLVQPGATSQIVQWVNGAYPTGGYLQVSAVLLSGLTGQRYFVDEMSGVSGAPLALIARQNLPQLARTDSISGAGTSFINAYVGYMAQAYMSIASVLCGAAVVLELQTAIQAPLGRWGTCGISVVSATKGADATYLVATYGNPGSYSTIPVNASQQIAGANGSAIIVAAGGSSSASQQIQDIEMAINNGSAIFSISSGTFTEP